jgi:hypothetical protein
MAAPSVPGRRRRQHWDAAYRDRGATGVSWFQPVASVSEELIRRLAVPPDAAIIDVGGGASILVDDLLSQGFRDLTVLDVSTVALDTVSDRLPVDAPVTLLHADLLSWKPDRRYDVWHDRAVLHFLVDDADRATYRETLERALRRGGYALIGTFASDGPEYCSGLPVRRCSVDDLVGLLGPECEVLAERREEHVTPGGVIQPFTWVAARLG